MKKKDFPRIELATDFISVISVLNLVRVLENQRAVRFLGNQIDLIVVRRLLHPKLVLELTRADHIAPKVFIQIRQHLKVNIRI